MKKILSLMIAFGLMVGLFAGCGANTENSGSSEAGKKVFKIGVIQLVEHVALDASYQGFVDGLKEAGYIDGDNIKIEFQNAQNEQANCVTIANTLINNKVDLILAIATPAAQAVAAATQDIPILVTAVTDPKTAELVESNEKPGTNVSGTSDLTPVAEQMALLKQLVPGAKKVGLFYCSNESNSKFQIDIAKVEAEKLGLQYEVATVSNSNEIQQVAESLASKVDAIYIPTDNMLAAGMATVGAVSEQAKVPVIVGEEGMVDKGGLATYGINYYNLGKQTAAMAVKVLKGEAKPKDMPIEYLSECNLKINTDLAAKIGVTIPQELKDKLK